jgi:hypothetical protein
MDISILLDEASDDRTEADREIIRQSLSEIALDLKSRLREGDLNHPVDACGRVRDRVHSRSVRRERRSDRWLPHSSRCSTSWHQAPIAPRVIPKGLYRPAKTLLGDAGIVDVTMQLGWFTDVSLTLMAFDVHLNVIGLEQ